MQLDEPKWLHPSPVSRKWLIDSVISVEPKKRGFTKVHPLKTISIGDGEVNPKREASPSQPLCLSAFRKKGEG